MSYQKKLKQLTKGLTKDLINGYSILNGAKIFFRNITKLFKVGLSPSKKNCVICMIKSPFKKDGKCFLFHVKSSFRSQDI